MSALEVHLWVALIALVLERFTGYPDVVFRLIRHPVVWIGALISLLDRLLNRATFSYETRKLNGAITLLILVFIATISAIIIVRFINTIPFGFVLEALLASAFLAQRSLKDHVKAVAKGLERSLHQGRTAVRHIVGRDPQELDESDISKAAVESLAENTADGVIAPLFWLVLFGLPGIVFYKTINTADSMIGHRSEKYHAFGWASARLDDGVNYLPARLTGLLFCLSACLSRSFDGRSAFQAMRRDASTHASPNAGWPEAAMAGGLALTLGGPRSYNGQQLALATMGNGRMQLTRQDIDRALTLYATMLTLTTVILLTFVFIALSL